MHLPLTIKQSKCIMIIDTENKQQRQSKMAYNNLKEVSGYNNCFNLVQQLGSTDNYKLFVSPVSCLKDAEGYKDEWVYRIGIAVYYPGKFGGLDLETFTFPELVTQIKGKQVSLEEFLDDLQGSGVPLEKDDLDCLPTQESLNDFLHHTGAEISTNWQISQVQDIAKIIEEIVDYHFCVCLPVTSDDVTKEEEDRFWASLEIDAKHWLDSVSQLTFVEAEKQDILTELAARYQA